MQCNWLLDPYLPEDPTSDDPSVPPAIDDAQADYGINFYGATEPRALHNYFHGVFNQTLSFKEGNRNPTAAFNTFEGSKLTALFFGQEDPHNGPFDYAGLPTGPDFGTLTAEGNAFRQVFDDRGVYYLRTPIRVWHVDGATVVRDNVVESSAQGLGVIECKTGPVPGCARGTVELSGNTVGGAVSHGGERVQVASGCLLAVDAWSAPTAAEMEVTMTAQTCVSAAPIVIGDDLPIAHVGTVELDGPITTLRAATPATDPDLSYRP